MKIYNDNLYINTKASKITKTPLHNQQPKILRQNNHRQPQTVLNFQSKTAWSASAKLLDVSSNNTAPFTAWYWLVTCNKQDKNIWVTWINCLTIFHLSSHEIIYASMKKFPNCISDKNGLLTIYIYCHIRNFPQLDQTSKIISTYQDSYGTFPQLDQPSKTISTYLKFNWTHAWYLVEHHSVQTA